ncbi:MAG: xylulose kinase, partial [Actinobacteria bacterium]|nr:xylulose kinase [Actinomycetota bacterium]
AVERQGVSYSRILLIGGAAKNSAVQQISADLFGRNIHIPPIGEYVADGAAKQAAWALSGKDEVPKWSLGEIREIAPKNPGPEIVEDYLDLISN